MRSAGSNLSTEVLAGVTTFVTMCYIVVVQPAMLGAAGMDPGAVFTATCLAAALGSFLMAGLANYPIALAPGMGENAYFTYAVCLGMGISWQMALGAIFISGLIFVLVSFVGLRERVMTAVPDALKLAIAAGIGLLIALVGLEWGGLVVHSPATLVTLGDFRQPAVITALAGLVVSAVLYARRVRGAILLGIAAAASAGLALGVLAAPKAVFALPPSIAPTFLQLDLPSWSELVHQRREFLTVIFIFFIMVLFDTVGTLIGVGQAAGLMKDGRLPRARQALLADALATSGGALLGSTTVTSYIESAAGVAEGGRTGMTAAVAGLLFLAVLFVHPLVQVLGAAVVVGGAELHPPLCGALVLVGFLMAQNAGRIPWEDATEGIPAFLCMIFMPLTFSITEGIAVGFIGYSLLKLASGRAREAHPLLHVLAALFLARYAFGLRG